MNARKYANCKVINVLRFKSEGFPLTRGGLTTPVNTSNIDRYLPERVVVIGGTAVLGSLINARQPNFNMNPSVVVRWERDEV